MFPTLIQWAWLRRAPLVVDVHYKKNEKYGSMYSMYTAKKAIAKF
jgi:hypothetical protein